MTPEKKIYYEGWKLLQEIKEKYLTTSQKQPLPPQNEHIHTAKPHGVETWLHDGDAFQLRKNIIYKLQEWKLFEVLDETREDFNYEGTRFILKILQPRFNEVYRSWEEINGNPWFSETSKIVEVEKLLKGKQKQSEEKIDYGKPKQDSDSEKKLLNRAKATCILIKDARLDEQNYFLEINNGEKIISFKSKKEGIGLKKETKRFKILYHLWDFRWELKGSRVLKKGNLISLDNLMRGGGIKSTGATYKHIQRLNDRFKKEGVAIEIEGKNEKYRLIINRA